MSVSAAEVSACALAADNAMHAIADGLTGEGFDIRGPAWDRSRYLKIMNVRATWCEIVIREDGIMRWEYRPFDNGRVDPERASVIVLAVLGGDGQDLSLPGDLSGLPFKGVVGRVVSGQGMQVRMGAVVSYSFFYDLYSEIKIFNPAREDRGAVWVSDDGVVRWECQFGDGEGSTGLADIMETIAQVLEPSRLR